MIEHVGLSALLAAGVLIINKMVEGRWLGGSEWPRQDSPKRAYHEGGDDA